MQPSKPGGSPDKKPRKMRNPVDIALDAGMRPMLIGHGFTRKTKRYFVRETSSAVQFVAINPPHYRTGYLNCLYIASAGIIMKDITELVEILDLRRLTALINHANRDCHFSCTIDEIYKYNARIDIRKIKSNKIFFLRPFVKFPKIEIYIPEMNEFGRLCRKIDSVPAPSNMSELTQIYAQQESNLFEKYMLPWFDKCEDREFSANWIEYLEGRGTKSGNLLLATAFCLASNFDRARPYLQSAISRGEKTYDEIYRDALRYENKKKYRKTSANREKAARKNADMFFVGRKRKALDARALARHFGIDLG